MPVKIILDHCLPRRLANAFANHFVRTSADLGWEKLLNGILLARAATEFDVFLTIDKNLKHEQNLATLPIAVVVIMASSNRLNDVLPFVPAVQSQLAILKPNSFVEVNLI